MSAFEWLAEERLREAIGRGDFDDLLARGAPLALEDLSGLDPELRAGYLLLRGAGVLPEEMALRKEALRLGHLLAACEEAGARERLERERSAVLLRQALLAEARRERAGGGRG